jgi:hypothetical protein
MKLGGKPPGSQTSLPPAPPQTSTRLATALKDDAPIPRDFRTALVAAPDFFQLPGNSYLNAYTFLVRLSRTRLNVSYQVDSAPPP